MGKVSKKVEAKLLSEMVQKVGEIIHRYFGPKEMMILGCSETELLDLCNEVVQSGLIEDLVKFANSDPAAKKNYLYVLAAYKGFQATIYYRVAHNILVWNMYQDADDNIRQFILTLVRRISEEGAVKTGIEIHPAAVIGPGLVIDHGVGTKICCGAFDNEYRCVIGETVIIGSNCTILNDVVIGSSIVNTGPSRGRRQPKIGDNVTICAGARLYGKIEIGNNVWIGPKCMVCQDIPSNTKVTALGQIQITKSRQEDKNFFLCDGLIKENDIFVLGGSGMKESMLSIVDDKYRELRDVEIVILYCTENLVYFKIETCGQISFKSAMLKIITKDKHWHYISSFLLERELRRMCS